MSSVRYRARHLLTMVGDVTLISPGVVDVDDGIITWVGPSGQAPEQTIATVDGQTVDRPTVEVAGLLMPGMINTHAHTPMTLLRGAGEGLPLLPWLNEVMFPREARIQRGDVVAGMTVGGSELLANGITTSVEMYFAAEEIIEASARLGLRTVVTGPLIEVDDFARYGTIADQLQAVGELADARAGDPLTTIGVGPHSAYTLSEGALVGVAELAAAKDLLVHIHVAEARHEGDAVTERTGLTVPAYLDRLGLWNGPAIAAHGVWLADEDIDLLARRHVGVAHCPGSNGKHASGIAPISDLRRAGVSVGVATDGPASSNRLDLFEEARLAMRYARLRSSDAADLVHHEVLAMMTSEAADAIGRPDLGRLSPGCAADMIEIDLEANALAPVLDEQDLITHLVWGGSPDAVRSVWVAGRQVVEEGRCTTVDMVGATAELSARSARLASR